MHYPTLSFSVHVFQCTVDLLHLRCQGGELSADICCDLLLAMKTFILFYMLCHFFGYRVMVSEQAAKEGRKFVAMLRSSCFHRRVLFGEKHIITKWGFEKCLLWLMVIFCYINYFWDSIFIGTDVDNFLFCKCIEIIFFSMKYLKIDKKSPFSVKKRFCKIPHWKQIINNPSIKNR